MTTKMALAYAKYCLAIKKGIIDDDTREAISILFSDESIFEKYEIIGVIINTLFKSYKESNKINLAKEECLKLKFGKYIPRKEIFTKILDLLSVDRNEEYETQIRIMKETESDIILGDRNIDPIYKAVYRLMIQRLIVLTKGEENAIISEPDFSSKVINRLDELDKEGIEDSLEFFVWY